jgi:hypothetical protein
VKVSKTVSHRINMGDFESLTLGASCEIDTDDPGVESREAALEEIDQTITDALSDDLRQARRLAKDSSYIRDYERD